MSKALGTSLQPLDGVIAEGASSARGPELDTAAGSLPVASASSWAVMALRPRPTAGEIEASS